MNRNSANELVIEHGNTEENLHIFPSNWPPFYLPLANML